MTDERAGFFLNALKENHKVNKCTECECLQGGLAQLKADYPEFAEEIATLTTGKFHRQPGCNPCPPGNAWTRYSLSEG